MTGKILQPGSMLGVLGGGQLGAMFAEAAWRMGYQVTIWDPDPDAPAHRLASRSFTTSFSDHSTQEQFAQIVHAVTFEWESVPASLCEWLERHRRVRPGSAVLRILQDRITQKQFLHSCGLPVAPFASLETPDDLPMAVTRLGLPAVCKTATTGYDGKGQWVISRQSDVARVQNALQVGARPGLRWILETLIPFERELSVLVVREQDGAAYTYPVVENRHEHGILRLTLVPASLPPSAAARAGSLARQAVTAIHGVGVLCVEFFQRPDGELLINEIAPRPHNSGHYTLDACSVSQFEQQVRVLCGLPVGEVRLFSQAAMVNLIGNESREVTAGSGFQDLLAVPGAVLHLYGKRVVRAGRKMGHVTFLAEQSEVAAKRAAQFVSRLS